MNRMVPAEDRRTLYLPQMQGRNPSSVDLAIPMRLSVIKKKRTAQV